MTSSKEHFDLLFDVRRSIRYHSKRQAFYERLDRLSDFALLLLGSGTVVLVLQAYPKLAVAAGFCVAFISGLRHVYSYGLKAGLHARFVRDFTQLEKRLCSDDSDETVDAVTQERLDLEATEPPVMRVLDTICHNDLLVAMGLDSEDQRVHLSWFQRLTANFLSHSDLRLVKGEGQG